MKFMPKNSATVGFVNIKVQFSILSGWYLDQPDNY